jgi:UDP-2,3-diacylglucosamine hydrolase
VNTPPPLLAEVDAPAHWRTVDFISDLHLQASEPRTVQAWKDYLAGTPADAVFLLGDLFEVWVGDDGLDEPDNAAASAESAFERDCIAALQAASAHRALYFLHGNRDFLLGAVAAQRAGMALLADPAVLVFGAANGQPARWLLSHGDALCLDDREYQVFRAQTRAPQWQQGFLSQPLAQRRAFARNVRAQSEARKQASGGNFTETYADADPALMRTWLKTAGANRLIHGHTHRPGDQVIEAGPDDAPSSDASPLMRHVLSDWHLDGPAPRAEVLRLSLAQAGGAPQLQRLPLSEALAPARPA